MASSYELHNDDAWNVLAGFPDNSIDAVVTDPPYGLGFMGKSWDKVDTPFRVDFWQEVLRVLKPGGHALVFGGTRTYHRVACAVEDAGFEVRDQIQWLYGSGFPKIGYITGAQDTWSGCGGSLKPASEPILLARKPLAERNVAANVLAYGTGAINIDGCRIGETGARNNGRKKDSDIYGDFGACEKVDYGKGRFPTNVLHDGSDEVEYAFAAYGESKSTGGQASLGAFRNGDIYGKGRDEREQRDPSFGDSGTATRFFYSAKASKRDRDCGHRGITKHPTVKPVALMEYLSKMVTPPKGTVLDPFAGSGTLGEAALQNGFCPVLVEKDESYSLDIQARLERVPEPTEKPKDAVDLEDLLE